VAAAAASAAGAAATAAAVAADATAARSPARSLAGVSKQGALLRAAKPRAEHEYAAKVLVSVCVMGPLDPDDDQLVEAILAPLANLVQAATESGSLGGCMHLLASLTTDPSVTLELYAVLERSRETMETLGADALTEREAIMLGASASLLCVLTLSGAIALVEMQALGVMRATALLVGELARENGKRWQRPGARVRESPGMDAHTVLPLSQALLASTRLLAAAVGSEGLAGSSTNRAVLHAVCAMHPIAAGEAGLAIRRAQRVAEATIDEPSDARAL